MLPASATLLMQHLPSLLTVALSSLPTILCHAPEKGHIFATQLEVDAVCADSAASADHCVKSHFF